MYSLYDTSKWYATIFQNLVKFIHAYQNSKELTEDQWAWYFYDYGVCGVCLNIAIYFIVNILDYCIMSPLLLSNQARFFISTL
jgi:hypothetical protein